MNEEIFQKAVEQIQKLAFSYTEEQKKEIRENFKKKCEEYDRYLKENNDFVLYLPQEIEMFRRSIVEISYKQFLKSQFKEKLCIEINIKNKDKEKEIIMGNHFNRFELNHSKKLRRYCEIYNQEKSTENNKEYLLKSSPENINLLCA